MEIIFITLENIMEMSKTGKLNLKLVSCKLHRAITFLQKSAGNFLFFLYATFAI